MRNPKIKEDMQELLLNTGIEVNSARKPVEAVMLSKKYGRSKNDTTLYARLTALEKAGYIKKHKETGERMKVSLTNKGWRFLGKEEGVQITPEGVILGDIDFIVESDFYTGDGTTWNGEDKPVQYVNRVKIETEKEEKEYYTHKDIKDLLETIPEGLGDIISLEFKREELI